MCTALVEIDASFIAPTQSGPAASSSNAPQTAISRTRKQALNSSDPLYASLRDANFAIVGTILNRMARRLSDDYEGRHQAKTVSQIRDFVNKLSGLQAEHQSLRLRIYPFECPLISDTNLAENIMSYTSSDTFSRTLEVQQSMLNIYCLSN